MGEWYQSSIPPPSFPLLIFHRNCGGESRPRQAASPIIPCLNGIFNPFIQPSLKLGQMSMVVQEVNANNSSNFSKSKNFVNHCCFLPSTNTNSPS